MQALIKSRLPVDEGHIAKSALKEYLLAQLRNCQAIPQDEMISVGDAGEGLTKECGDIG